MLQPARFSIRNSPFFLSSAQVASVKIAALRHWNFFRLFELWVQIYLSNPLIFLWRLNYWSFNDECECKLQDENWIEGICDKPVSVGLFPLVKTLAALACSCRWPKQLPGASFRKTTIKNSSQLNTCFFCIKQSCSHQLCANINTKTCYYARFLLQNAVLLEKNMAHHHHQELYTFQNTGSVCVLHSPANDLCHFILLQAEQKN